MMREINTSMYISRIRTSLMTETVLEKRSFSFCHLLNWNRGLVSYTATSHQGSIQTHMSGSGLWFVVSGPVRMFIGNFYI